MLHLNQLRKDLHKYPELSGQEEGTAIRIQDFINQHRPSHMISNIGGQGLLAIYNFGNCEPVVAIRCEMDALPIHESNNIEYVSSRPGVSHKCGHDGHMTMVAGLASWLSQAMFNNGTVVLLFQPAEETGKGALNMLQDEKFKSFSPDYIFALHNLPGYPKHEIIKINNQFSPTVISLAMHFNGTPSHASQPKKGINPSAAISELCIAVQKLQNDNPADKDYALITPVHINVGSKDYGISPGYGEFHSTIRTWSQETMSAILSRIDRLVQQISAKYGLSFKIEKCDYFPSVMNNDVCNKLVTDAANNLKLSLKTSDTPLQFGEDFGFFTNKFKGAMFGLGAGLKTPPLHNPNYDFPDDLLDTGISMFKEIITQILSE